MGPSASRDLPALSTSCARCGVPYDWRKSSSWTLKMTYCTSLCERGDLGFSLETFFRGTVIERFAWRDVPVAELLPAPADPSYPILLA